MPQEGFVMKEGELINKRSVVLLYANKCPEIQGVLGCGDKWLELVVMEAIEGSGTKNLTKR